MHTPGFTWYTAPLPSRASSLLQVHLPTRPASAPSFLWELACQRCIHRDFPDTPHRCHREQARSYRCACPPNWPANHHFCGSWLASDAYTGIAAIASKLAPTGAPAHPPTRPASAPSFLWELACQRCIHRDLPGTPHRCPPARPVHHHFCGSWLASDAYTGIAAIASKLAPTGPSAHLPTRPASEPSLLWAQGCQPTLARALSRRSGLRENTWLAQPLRSLAASMALRMASSTASAAATNNGEM